MTQVNKLVTTDRALNDSLGLTAVVVEGNYMVVSSDSQTDESNLNPIAGAGAAYVFNRDLSGNWTEGQKLVSVHRAANNDFGYSISACGAWLAIGEPMTATDATDSNTLTDAGCVQIFRNVSGTWTFVQKVVDQHRGADIQFGRSVCLYGDWLIVGCPEDNRDLDGLNPAVGRVLGMVSIFRRNRSTNVFEFVKKLETPKRVERILQNSDVGFGVSVSMFDNILAVGAVNEEYDVANGNLLVNAGAVFYYKLTNDDFIYLQKTCASHRVADGFYGISVRCYRDKIVVGSNGDQLDADGLNLVVAAGAVYVYVVVDNVVRLVNKVVSDNRQPGDNLGTSVDVFDRRVVANDKLFLQLDTSLTTTNEVYLPYGNNFPLGTAMAISGDGNLVIVGEPAANSNAGRITVFENSTPNIPGGTWVAYGNVINGAANSLFGSSVAINEAGTIIAVGAPTTSGVGGAGQVFVYEWDGTTWVQQSPVINGPFAGARIGNTRGLVMNRTGTRLIAGGTLTNFYTYLYNGSTWDLEYTGPNSGDVPSFALATSVDRMVHSNRTTSVVTVRQKISGTWTSIGTFNGNTGTDSWYRVHMNRDGSAFICGTDLPSGALQGYVKVYQASVVATSFPRFEQLGQTIQQSLWGDGNTANFGSGVFISDDKQFVGVVDAKRPGFVDTVIYIAKWNNVTKAWDPFDKITSVGDRYNTLDFSSDLRRLCGVGSAVSQVYQIDSSPTINGSYSYLQTLVPNDLMVGDLEGTKASIQGRSIATSSPGVDDTATDTGAVYAFRT